MLINKFRGDKDILTPGVRMIEERTGIPVLGVIPYMYVDIDEEDSLAPRLRRTGPQDDSRAVLDIAVIRFPRISNFTDLAPLESDSMMDVRYVERADEFGSPDLVILPGTKSTLDDLAWLRESGLEMTVRKFAGRGGAVLGICGGYQMLGEELNGTEGSLDGMKGIALPVRQCLLGKRRGHGCGTVLAEPPVLADARKFIWVLRMRKGVQPYCAG